MSASMENFYDRPRAAVKRFATATATVCGERIRQYFNVASEQIEITQ